MAKSSPETQLADAALKCLAKTRWDELALADVAKAAKIPLTTLQTLAPSKSALLGLILARLGHDVAARYKRDSGSESARDRIFDVAMTWFDVLAARKQAVRSLYNGLKRDPLALVAARGEILSAAGWLLVLAEADTGPSGSVKSAGLVLALARAIPVWLDDGKDLAKTMARLDGDLRRAESMFGFKKKAAANT
ncbi:MAG: TetR/AcrR family transcriptional regulator [Rhizomicrobium sp.]|jgi:AcrR family transcriptional regulator